MKAPPGESHADSNLDEHHIEMRKRGEEIPLIQVVDENDSSQHNDEPAPRRAPIGARVDQTDDETDDDPLLEVMDRIEDEVDGNLYDDLVPLHVKLALEENVFGWSHLMSDIFGHIMFTAGYYFVTFAIITKVGWKYTSAHEYELRWGMSEEFFRSLRFILSFFAGVSGFRTVRRRRRVWLRAPYGTQEYVRDEQRRRLSVEESDRTTVLGRIRRRRDGWLERRVQRKLFKASSRFEKRIRRKKGKVLRVLRPRSDAEYSRVRLSSDDGDQVLSPSSSEKKRKKPRFRTDRLDEPTASQRTGHTGPTENIESIAHDQILFKPGPILNMPYAHGGFFGAAPFMLANPYWIDILRHLMPDVYVEISRRVVNAPASKLIHWAENNPVVAAYGTAHELEYNGRVPNLEWDVFLDPHLVNRVEVVLDERDKFLKSRESSATASEASMTQGERTILRYYDAEIRRRTHVLVDRMLIAHGNLTQLILEQTGFAKKYNFSRVKRTRRTLGGGIYARQWLSLYAEALKMGMCDDEDVEVNDGEDRGLYWTGSSDSSDVSLTASSDDEVEWNVKGDSLQTTGCSSSEGEDTKNSPDPAVTGARSSPTAIAPTHPSPETPTNGEELRRRTGKPPHYELSGQDTPPRNERDILRRQQSTSLNALAWSKCPDTSITMSISILKTIMQCNAPIGLFLDIKSRHVSKRIWALIVDTLREAGARVEGVCSFYLADIRGISSYCSTPVKEVIFFHSAGDMQQACHDGRIQNGDIVLFNGGSLLWESPEYVVRDAVRKVCMARFDPLVAKGSYKFLPFVGVTSQQAKGSGQEELVRTSSSSMERQMDGKVASQDRNVPLPQGGSTIQQYKERFDLSIGLYCQEFSIDEAAANILVKLVNDHSHIYDLGLSWGGVNGITVRDIQPGRFTSTDGFWNQRYLGASWDASLSPAERSD